MDANTLYSCIKALVADHADIYVISRDVLQNIRFMGRNLIVVCNTATSKEYDAQGHWLLFITFQTSSGIVTEYFDSFCLMPCQYNISYPYPIIKVPNFVTQSKSSSYCGHLCLYYIYVRLGRHPKHVETMTKDTARNEYLAIGLFERLLPKTMPFLKPTSFQCHNFGCIPNSASSDFSN